MMDARSFPESSSAVHQVPEGFAASDFDMLWALSISSFVLDQFRLAG
jgi:hypothetical protein